MNLKTRVAPSPTGNGIVHMGTLRQMYHNWLFARSLGGSFLVRIDDTDLERSNEDVVTKLFEALDWLGLDYDETFKQSDRFDLYRGFAEKLVKEGLAKHDDGCIRMSGEEIDCSWKDEITGEKADSAQIRDYSKNQVIIKSDGSPTYNFCSVVDDAESGVTHVIRGADHISNTYKQAYIYRSLGWDIPDHYHVGLICHTSGKKLSKRDSDAMNLSSFHPDAVLNYILRMGWSPTKDDKSNNIIDKEKALKLFVNHGSLRASNARIDDNKLRYYDRYYKRIHSRR